MEQRLFLDRSAAGASNSNRFASGSAATGASADQDLGSEVDREMEHVNRLLQQTTAALSETQVDLAIQTQNLNAAQEQCQALAALVNVAMRSLLVGIGDTATSTASSSAAATPVLQGGRPAPPIYGAGPEPPKQGAAAPYAGTQITAAATTTTTTITTPATAVHRRSSFTSELGQQASATAQRRVAGAAAGGGNGGGSGGGGGGDDWSFAEHPGAQPIPFPMSAATRAFLQSDDYDDDGFGGGGGGAPAAPPSFDAARFSTPVSGECVLKLQPTMMTVTRLRSTTDQH
jgi:hypothetical protein